MKGATLTIIMLATIMLATLLSFCLPVTSMAQDTSSALDEASAKKLVSRNCLMCHGEEMITQQHLSKPAWVRVLQKMQGWGAPLSSSEVESLATYLASRYGPDSTASEPARIRVEESAETRRTAASAVQPANANRGAELYVSHCAACHGSNGRGKTGPNLLTFFLNEETDWQSIVLEGRRNMPAWKGRLTESEISDIRAWLLREANEIYKDR